MLKFGRKTDEPQNEVKSSDKEGKGSWFKENQRSIIAVALIAVMAFVMRFIFAFGVSADNAFALSGGVAASEHLHTITEMLTDGSFFGSDSSLNYPFGSVNSNPILIDGVLALIASIGTSLGMATVKAASLTLATFSVVCGTLAVIPMFLLGKEVIGTKKAGYVAALFLAFCPVVITQTVFSNGTETGWFLLLFLFLALYLFRGVKSINDATRMEDSFKEVLAANRSAIRTAAIAGLILALIVLSTNGFRPIVVLMIISMAVMTVVGRLTYKDTRMVSLFFTIAIMIGMAVAAAYYIPALLWDQVLSGILIASVFSAAVCVSFSMLQKKPWVVTVPAYLIAVIVVFVVLSFVAPELYGDIVSGNTVFSESVAALAGSALSISHIATNYGVISMWLVVAVIAVMLFRLPKNISSFVYQFTLMFLIVGAYFGTKSDELGTVFAPVYALGFAIVVMWLFDHVDFKSYFLAIKNAEIKAVWKKVLKPIPFATILAIAVLLCVPCAMYAVDASIPSNDADSYDGLDLGAIGYYIKTDSDWTTGPVLSSYSDTPKTGALVTWMDYADEASTLGNFKVTTDAQGNGAEAVSNILLSNAVDGSSTASSLIYLLTYTGFTDSVKTALTGKGLTEEEYNALKDAVENPGKYRSEVVGNVDKYGALSTSVSDENIKYIYGRELLTDNHDAFAIAQMYTAIASISGKNISYFMVNGSMFPVYYGYSSTFSTMGYVNGYTLSDNYGTVAQFLNVDYFTMYYTGIYAYKDAMYDTLLWRTYIGMSPAEAGFTGQLAAYNYLTSLMLSDGTYKAQPGYGLSNYTVDEEHWYVMYNEDSDATLTSDGWTKMLYTEAIQKQETSGGLINYLSGLPVFMKYVSNGSGTAVSGTVQYGTTPVSGIRVSVVDPEGTVKATAFTKDDGTYTVLVIDNASKIEFYAGSTNLTDGTLIATKDFAENIDITITATSVDGTFVDSEGAAVDMTGAKLVLKGQVSKNEYPLDVTAATFTIADIVPDVYDVTLTSADGSVSYVTDKKVTVNTGENKGVEIKLDASELTIVLKNDVAVSTKGIEVSIRDTVSGKVYGPFTSDASGQIETEVMNGTYVCDFTGDYVTTTGPFSVSGSTSKTITAHKATSYAFTGFPANRLVSVYSSGYQTSVSSGTGDFSILLPDGTGAALTYTAYVIDSEKGYMASNASLTAVTGTVKVTGTLKDSSDAAVSGTIVFMNDSFQIPVTAGSDGTYTVYLTAGDWTVYANKGSEVSISKITVSDTMTQDIKLAAGTAVSGKTYWVSSSLTMAFVPIAVSEITGCDGISFNVMSDSAGAYSFYIPSDATCTLKATCKDPFYYDNTGTYEKTETEVSGTKDFKASTGKVNVTNSSARTISVAGTKIAAGENKDISITWSTWTVTIDDDTVDPCIYYSKSMPVTPGVNITYTDADFDLTDCEYYKYTITGLADDDTVTLKAIDDGKTRNKTTTGAERVYYLQKDEQFLITVKNADSNKVRYISTTATASTSIVGTPVDAATFTGYVGLVDDGKLTVTIGTDTFEFDIDSSGRYSVLLPIGSDITFTADIVDDTDDHTTYTYTGAITVATASLTAGETYTNNIAVIGGGAPAASDLTATLSIDSMTGEGIADVEFTVSVTNSAVAPEMMTYVLSGGSSWTNVVFFSDAARTTQISTVTFDAATTFYGKGMLIKSSIAVGTDNLSVILTDINGEEACHGKFAKDDANWSKTTPTAETTKVNIGTNSIGDSEYMFAVELVNEDNFAKTFTLVPTGISADSWFITYQCGKEITGDGKVVVDGYTTATAYVKITSKTGDSAQVPADISIAVTADGITEMSTDSSESVTISGATATAVSVSGGSSVTVDQNGATGRGVLDSKSDMPTYVWLILAAIVALLFLIIWSAVRRGVFTRRK